MNTVLFFGFCNSAIGAGAVIMYLHGKDKTTQCTYVQTFFLFFFPPIRKTKDYQLRRKCSETARVLVS